MNAERAEREGRTGNESCSRSMNSQKLPRGPVREVERKMSLGSAEREGKAADLEEEEGEEEEGEAVAHLS